MLPIVSTVIGIFAEKIGGKVVAYLDVKFDELSEKIVKHQVLKKDFLERDRLALELKEDIKIANTKEERDVLLDKMDELLRTNLKF